MLREPQIHLGLWVELEKQKIVVFELDQPNACGLGKRDQKLIKIILSLLNSVTQNLIEVAYKQK
jgi:hypothetical protein